MTLLLLKYWPYIAAVLAILALFIGFQVRGSHIKVLEAQATTLQTQLEASQGSVKSLQSAITDQNAIFEAFKTAADKRLAAQQKLLDQAVISRNKANLAASKLLARPMQQDKNVCENADQIINEELAK